MEDALVRQHRQRQGETGRAVNVQRRLGDVDALGPGGEPRDLSVYVGDADSPLRLKSCLVAHTQPDAYGYFGRGAEMVSGTLSIEDWLLDNRDVGVHALGPRARGR